MGRNATRFRRRSKSSLSSAPSLLTGRVVDLDENSCPLPTPGCETVDTPRFRSMSYLLAVFSSWRELIDVGIGKDEISRRGSADPYRTSESGEFG